jgi:hypothetical protein
VRTTTELAVWVGRYDNPVPGEIDNPPTVVETLGGAKVRAWLPVAALSHDDEIEIDEVISASRYASRGLAKS